MAKAYLSDITTQWTEFEAKNDKGGPEALAEFLAATYHEPIILRFKRSIPQISNEEAHELATEVFFRLIKNDYRGIKRIKRGKGRMKGLFGAIIQGVISDKFRQSQREQRVELEKIDLASKDGVIEGFSLDLQAALTKMKEKHPFWHDAFAKIYIDGQKREEFLAQANAQRTGQAKKLTMNNLNQRLHQARCWLAQELKEYEQEV